LVTIAPVSALAQGALALDECRDGKTPDLVIAACGEIIEHHTVDDEQWAAAYFSRASALDANGEHELAEKDRRKGRTALAKSELRKAGEAHNPDYGRAGVDADYGATKAADCEYLDKERRKMGESGAIIAARKGAGGLKEFERNYIKLLSKAIECAPMMGLSMVIAGKCAAPWATRWVQMQILPKNGSSNSC
jgi:hypothetical protein